MVGWRRGILGICLLLSLSLLVNREELDFTPPEPLEPPPLTETMGAVHKKLTEMLALSNYEDALRLANHFLATYPNDRTAWLARVKSLNQRGPIREMLNTTEEAVKRFPNDPAFWAERLDALDDDFSFQQALDESQAISQILPDNPLLLVARANILVNQHKNAEADAMAEMAMLLGGEDPEVALLLADYFDARGKFREAKEVLDHVMPKVYGQPRFVFHLAYAYYKLGLKESALLEIDRAIALNPSYPTPLLAKIEWLVETGNMKEATTIFSHMDELVRENPIILRKLGSIARYSFLNTDKTNAYMLKSLSIDPENISTQLNYIQFLVEQYFPDEAMKRLDKIWDRVSKTSSSVWLVRGKLHAIRNENDSAMSAYRKAVEIDPEDAKAWNELGIFLVEQEKLNEAEMCFQKVQHLDAKSDDGYLGVAEILRKQKRFTEAISVLDHALSLGLETPNIYKKKALLLKESGKMGEAKDEFFKAIGKVTDNNKGIIVRGLIYAAMSDYDKASEYFRRAIRSGMNFPAIWNFYIYILVELHKYNEALLQTDNAIAKNNRYPQFWEVKGQILEKLKRKDSALEAWKRATDLAPWKHLSYFSYGLLLWDNEQFSDAINAFRKASELSPKIGYYFRYIAFFLLEMGRPAEALLEIEKAIEVAPTDDRNWSFKGDILEAENRMAEAVQAYRASIRRAPGRFAPYESLAKVLLKLNRHVEGIDVLNEGWMNVDEAFSLDRIYVDLVEKLPHPDVLIAKLDERVEKDPLNPDLWAKKAFFLSRTGFPEKALCLLDQSISLTQEQDRPRLHLFHVDLLEKLGRNDDAISLLTWMIAEKKDEKKALRQKGRLLSKTRRYWEALTLWRNTMDRYPQEEEWAKGYAESLANLGMSGEELHLLDELKARFPDKTWPFEWQLEILKKAGRLEDALSLLDTPQAAIHPDSGWFLDKKAEILEQLGRWTEADQLHREIVAYEPSRDHLHSYASFLKKNGRDEESIAVLNRILARFPTDHQAYKDKVANYEEKHDFQKAEEVVNAGLALFREAPVAQGDLKRKREKVAFLSDVAYSFLLNKAIRTMFGKGVESFDPGPSQTVLREALTTIENGVGQIEFTEERINILLKLHRFEEVIALSGHNSKYRSQAREKAMTVIGEKTQYCRELNRNFPESPFSEAECWLDAGNYNKARESAARILHNNPDGLDVLISSRLLHDLGMEQEVTVYLTNNNLLHQNFPWLFLRSTFTGRNWGFTRLQKDLDSLVLSRDKALTSYWDQKYLSDPLQNNSFVSRQLKHRREAENGNLTMAIEGFQLLRQERPTDISITLDLAQVLEDAKEPKQAEQLHRMAMVISPMEPEPLVMFGKFLLRQKRFQEAITILEKAREWSDRPETRLEFTKAVIEIGDYQRAESLLSDLPKTVLERSNFLMVQGSLAMATRTYKDAAEKFSKAMVRTEDRSEPGWAALWYAYSHYMDAVNRERKSTGDRPPLSVSETLSSKNVREKGGSEGFSPAIQIVLPDIMQALNRATQDTATKDTNLLISAYYYKGFFAFLGQDYHSALRFLNQALEGNPPEHLKNLTESLIKEIWMNRIKFDFWTWWWESQPNRGLTRIIFLTLCVIVCFSLISLWKLGRSTPSAPDQVWYFRYVLLVLSLASLFLPVVHRIESPSVNIALQSPGTSSLFSHEMFMWDPLVIEDARRKQIPETIKSQERGDSSNLEHSRDFGTITFPKMFGMDRL